MELKEEKIEEKLVFSGKIINVYVDKVKLPNGKVGRREVVRHRGAVAAVPYEKGKVYLVKQFRYAANRVLLEIPAGKLDEDDEDPEWRIKEELKEEIGKYPKKLEYLGYIYTSPGFATEKIHLYLATDLVDEKEKGDEDEFIEVEVMDLEEAFKKCINGEIVDSKTIAAITRAWFRIKGRDLDG